MKFTNILLIIILCVLAVNTIIDFGVLVNSSDLMQRFIDYVNLVTQGGY